MPFRNWNRKNDGRQRVPRAQNHKNRILAGEVSSKVMFLAFSLQRCRQLRFWASHASWEAKQKVTPMQRGTLKTAFCDTPNARTPFEIGAAAADKPGNAFWGRSKTHSRIRGVAKTQKQRKHGRQGKKHGNANMRKTISGKAICTREAGEEQGAVLEGTRFAWRVLACLADC